MEVGDFLRMIEVSPVEDRDAALVPGLDHHVASGNRDERAVVRDAVLLRCLRRGHLVVAVQLQLVVLDAEEPVRAPLHLAPTPAAPPRPPTPPAPHDPPPPPLF